MSDDHGIKEEHPEYFSMIPGASCLMIYLKTSKNTTKNGISVEFQPKKSAHDPYGSGMGLTGFQTMTRTQGKADLDP